MKNIYVILISLALIGFTRSAFNEVSGQLPAPTGYKSDMLIFDDQFQGATLDNTKWIPQIADRSGIWRKSVPAPYSAPNSGGFDAEYYDPSHLLTGSSGLKLIASRSTQFPDYSWASVCVCTHGLFYFSGGYVQIRAKMPDSRSGMWAGLWFLEGGGEIDLIETGNLHGTTDVNRVMACNLHTTGNKQQIIDAGVDLSADYHIYGMEYIPGKSVKMYLDGVLKVTYTNNIPAGAYEIIINLNVAQNAGSWHTIAGENTPSPSEFVISELQVYKLP